MNPSKSRRALEHSMRNTCWKVERKRKNGEKGGKAKIDEEKNKVRKETRRRGRGEISALVGALTVVQVTARVRRRKSE